MGTAVQSMRLIIAGLPGSGAKAVFGAVRRLQAELDGASSGLAAWELSLWENWPAAERSLHLLRQGLGHDDRLVVVHRDPFRLATLDGMVSVDELISAVGTLEAFRVDLGGRGHATRIEAFEEDPAGVLASIVGFIDPASELSAERLSAALPDRGPADRSPGAGGGLPAHVVRAIRDVLGESRIREMGYGDRLDELTAHTNGETTGPAPAATGRSVPGDGSGDGSGDGAVDGAGPRVAPANISALRWDSLGAFEEEIRGAGGVGDAAADRVIEELRETLGRESFLDREVTRLHEVSDALCRAHRAEIDAERERAYASERALHEQIAIDQARISDLEQIAAKHRIYEEMSNSDRVKDTARRILKRAIGRIAHPHTAHWPTISIVTPCYNAEATIEETVRSVLGQGYPHLQYIVQDGGSTDGTLEILEKYKDRVAVFSAPDGGMYDALAKGFAWTTGEVMGYLNADDTLEPGGLWRVAETFRNKPKTAVLYHEDVIQTNGWRTPNIAQPAGVHFFDLAFGRHILFQDGVWWRRHCYEAVHGVDPSFKLAGDYDLWLRMSLLFPFTRGEGHVSCFRKRQGQLSESADAYWEEVERAKKTLRGTLSVKHHARRVPRWIKSRTARVLARLRGRAFFYPLNPGFGLPPVDARPLDPSFPRCPLTRRPPDRLLFSTPDTRFGHPLLSRLWRCEASDTIVTDPVLGQDELNHLYETYYSTPQLTAKAPAPGAESPYRGYRGGSLAGRIAEKIRIPGRICNRINRSRLRPWNETTREELLSLLKPFARRDDDSVRFLDVGCFTGGMLDELRTCTAWSTHGTETNPTAAQEARGKGHDVYVGIAEDLWKTVPEGTLFDIIHLGQVIEHLHDPHAFCRRARTMLRPGGLLVLTTPNTDSMQLHLYGPCWSHWHAPFHRMLFGRRGLRLLGERSGYRLRRMRSSSNPGWTLLSQKLSEFGIAGSVPHDYQYRPEEMGHASSLAAWSRLFWDWRNRGDYLLAVFEAE